jgi:hypothetical protein
VLEKGFCYALAYTRSTTRGLGLFDYTCDYTSFPFGLIKVGIGILFDRLIRGRKSFDTRISPDVVSPDVVSPWKLDQPKQYRFDLYCFCSSALRRMQKLSRS